MRMRFGIGEKKPFVLDAIRKELGITRQRVDQLINRSIIKMSKINKLDSFKKEWEDVKARIYA